MPFNLTPLFPSLSPEDTLCAQEALWGLLKQQARLYAPDSTSLPVETAAALAESILLTLGAGRNPAVRFRQICTQISVRGSAAFPKN